MVLSGFSLGPQRVLSEYSGYSWVLRLLIFEYSGGSQVGTSPRAAATAQLEATTEMKAQAQSLEVEDEASIEM